MDERSIPWRELFSVSSIPMSVVDSTGHQIACNQAFADFFGFDPSELVDLDVSRVTREQDMPWTRRYMRRLLDGEIDRVEVDKTYVCKDGSLVRGRLSTRALRDADGVGYLIGAIVPIPDDVIGTEPGVADRLLEFGGETIALVDRDGKIVTVAGAQATVYGYPSSYWRARRLPDLVSQDEWERLGPVRDAVMAGPGPSVDTDVALPDVEGRSRTVAMRIHNCTDDPILDGYVVVLRDATSERETLAELTRRRHLAEEAVQAQTRLVATVSHELRNPLHALRGLAELLASEQLDERPAELATSLLRQLDGLLHVTEDLLDATRLDSGRFELSPVPTNLADLVDDVAELARAGVGERPVTVSARLARGVPEWVLVDQDRLRQVLSNLVGNAVKFTEYGSVQLIVRPATDGSVTFSVLDTGIGIPLSEQQMVLEPFAVGSTAGSARGAGLGLSIVHRLVTAMNGRVGLVSTVGRGTRFDVTLPLSSCAPPHESPRTDRADDLPVGLRVLVVEDNPVNQKLARNQLERLGLVPVVVGTGEEGLDELLAGDAEGFDVVLMDHQLPGWSGVETTQRIRALDGPLASIPIVGVSASASRADRDTFVQAGMNDFVPKPATLDDLAQAIASAVRLGRRTSAETAVDEENTMHEPPTSPDFDGTVLDRLGEDLGGTEILGELVGQFLSELGTRVEAIVGSVGDDLRRAAHTLKSTARLLGAERLADLCLEIERGAEPPDDLVDIADRCRSRLEEWCAERLG